MASLDGLARRGVASRVLRAERLERSAGGDSGLSGVIPIGAVWSLTGPGASFGPQQRNAAALAVEGVNGTGFLGHATIRLVVEDDQSAPPQAVAAFRKLIDRDHVVAILGPTLSTSARQADLVAQERQVPVLGVSNTADGIVEIGDYVFRDSLPESQVQPNMVRVTRRKLGYERVAIIYAPDDAFTMSGYQAFQQALEASGPRSSLRSRSAPAIETSSARWRRFATCSRMRS
jgi:branched-chain amino acid transport system substrate-binding protein